MDEQGVIYYFPGALESQRLKQSRQDQENTLVLLHRWMSLAEFLDEMVSNDNTGVVDLYRFALNDVLLRRRIFADGVLLTTFQDRDLAAKKLKLLVRDEISRLKCDLSTFHDTSEKLKEFLLNGVSH